VGAVALAVSGMAAATGKRSWGYQHRGQRRAALGMVEDSDQAWWSRRCRVPLGRRVENDDRRRHDGAGDVDGDQGTAQR
jgi:hypothetical protein